MHIEFSYRSAILLWLGIHFYFAVILDTERNIFFAIGNQIKAQTVLMKIPKWMGARLARRNKVGDSFNMSIAVNAMSFNFISTKYIFGRR
jgi:hypothetical protein